MYRYENAVRHICASDVALCEAVINGYHAIMEDQYTKPTIDLRRHAKRRFNADNVSRKERYARLLETPSVHISTINRLLDDPEGTLSSLFMQGLKDGAKLFIEKHVNSHLAGCIDIWNQYDEFHFGDPVNEDMLYDICTDSASQDLPYLVESVVYLELAYRNVDRSTAEMITSCTSTDVALDLCQEYCPYAVAVPTYVGGAILTELGGGTDEAVLQYRDTVTNTWLVHFTTMDSAKNIANTGFDRGNRIGALAYNHDDIEFDMDDTERYSGDYLFAYPLSLADRSMSNNSYGMSAVIFKSSAVKIDHTNDRPLVRGAEYDCQYIFDRSIPDSFFLLIPDSKGEYTVFGQGMRKLFHGNDMDRCLVWLDNNADTYAHMMFRPGHRALNESIVMPLRVTPLRYNGTYVLDPECYEYATLPLYHFIRKIEDSDYVPRKKSPFDPRRRALRPTDELKQEIDMCKTFASELVNHYCVLLRKQESICMFRRKADAIIESMYLDDTPATELLPLLNKAFEECVGANVYHNAWFCGNPAYIDLNEAMKLNGYTDEFNMRRRGSQVWHDGYEYDANDIIEKCFDELIVRAADKNCSTSMPTREFIAKNPLCLQKAVDELKTAGKCRKSEYTKEDLAKFLGDDIADPNFVDYDRDAINHAPAPEPYVPENITDPKVRELYKRLRYGCR